MSFFLHKLNKSLNNYILINNLSMAKKKITSRPINKNKSNSHSKSILKQEKKIRELNGPKGLEPTRYGDWEKNGRCSDF